MNKIILVFFLFVLMSTKTEANAFKENDAFSQLHKHISLNENDIAWQYARNLEDEYLGDAEFDFLYGLVALRVNEDERAVYAFERVVANKPNWLDAQYYLAISYFKMKNYHAVIAITNGLEQRDNLSVKLKSSLNQLKQRTLTLLDKQSLYLNQAANISLGHDSNINAGTSEDKIFLPLLGEEILLSDSSRENSDNYIAVDYQLHGSKALTQSSEIKFSGMGQLHTFTNESDYNRIIVNTNVEYIKDFDAFKTSIGLRVTPLWLNDSFYRTQFGMTLGVSKIINDRWTIAADTYLGKTNNKVNDLLNTDDKLIQAALQYTNDTWQHVLSIVYSEEISESDLSKHNDRKINGVSYSSYWAITQHWLFNTSISYQQQAYQFEHPFYFEKRTDDMWLLAAAIQYQATNMWSYRFSANIQDKDSNLSLFSYQRADISLSARMSF